ncbi:MAG: hypothetical protein M1814_003975 [Vezdaea aestivalis]|nr:MAG: hypothetical protein M1814_003975 [Vezdaea aestivalis]
MDPPRAPDESSVVPVDDGLHTLVTGLTIQSPSSLQSQASLTPQPGLDSPSFTLSTSSTSMINTPNRSTFTPVPTPASITPENARASISSLPQIQLNRPLSANLTPATSSKRTSIVQTTASARQGTRRLRRFPKAEKEVDDLTLTADRGMCDDRRGSATPTAVTRLFAATDPASSSRARSSQRHSGIGYAQAPSTPTPLPHHLYTRGFLDGRHSDITIHAFGRSYPLHRIILDRAPFFASALSEPWAESTAKEVTLHPEDLDSNITPLALELALKRLYGVSITEDEDAEAVGLFATACWLEMPDLVDSSVDSLLRQLKTNNIGNLIRLVTNNYYGQAGERLLSSAKAMLYREGWEVPLRCWDDIPADVIKEVVGGDGFFILGEWERWNLTKRILDRRLRIIFLQSQSMKGKNKAGDAPTQTLGSVNALQDLDDEAAQEIYDHPEVAPILALLDDSVYYIHLSFEQLQHIKRQKDILGRPVIAESIVTNALWSALELRQKIVNVNENHLELGLRQTIFKNPGTASPDPMLGVTSDSSAGEGDTGTSSRKVGWVKIDLKQVESCQTYAEQGEPPRWLIPSLDSTSVVGESSENGGQSISFRTSSSAHPPSHHESAWHPSDALTTTTETVPVPTARLKSSTPSRSSSAGPTTPPSYTKFPPFRFSAEFPNPRALKERKRVYSRTVWYAGSMWNIYIQKVRSTKSTQLGVYLHRARDRDADELHNTLGHAESSVDERIGHLEREMLLRRSERRARRQRQYEAQLQVSDDSASSGVEGGSRPMSSRGGSKIRQSNQDPNLLLSSAVGREEADGDSDGEEEDDNTVVPNQYSTPTMPPYVDTRPTIKTYFKIFSPSRGGRLLSVYESAPDTFNYSQSWGWKSSTLILEDGIKDSDNEDRARDGRLRFSVVLGNV